MLDKDYTGETFGSWTVLEAVTRNEKGSQVMLCQCSCGLIRHVLANSLVGGRSSKCQNCMLKGNRRTGFGGFKSYK